MQKEKCREEIVCVKEGRENIRVFFGGILKRNVFVAAFGPHFKWWLYCIILSSCWEIVFYCRQEGLQVEVWLDCGQSEDICIIKSERSWVHNSWENQNCKIQIPARLNISKKSSNLCSSSQICVFLLWLKFFGYAWESSLSSWSYGNLGGRHIFRSTWKVTIITLCKNPKKISRNKKSGAEYWRNWRISSEQSDECNKWNVHGRKWKQIWGIYKKSVKRQSSNCSLFLPFSQLV